MVVCWTLNAASLGVLRSPILYRIWDLFFDYGIWVILTIFLDFLKKYEEFPYQFRAKNEFSQEKHIFSIIYRIRKIAKYQENILS